jgi:methenyltetrahydrofolate cyclohydrolase
MTASLWDLPLGTFRDQTASAEPTPGGGSVCAVSGALGLGLVVMALEITRRKSSPERTVSLDAALSEARATIAALSSAADEDVSVFATYMAAHGLPKQTEAEQQARTEALRLASHEAAKVPLSAARHTLKGLEIAEQAAELCSAHVISDVLAGAELVHAATLGLLVTLRMNLRPDDTSPELFAYRTQHDDLTALAGHAIRAARDRITARLETR